MTTEERLARLENDTRALRTDLTGIMQVAYALAAAAKKHLPPDAKAALTKTLIGVQRNDAAVGVQINEGAESFATELLEFLHSERTSDC